jgi:hypothetical protein
MIEVTKEKFYSAIGPWNLDASCAGRSTDTDGIVTTFVARITNGGQGTGCNLRRFFLREDLAK